MKRGWLLLFTLAVLLVFSGVANADLITIGTATYGGTNYNLIYEDDQGLIWLDYTQDQDKWDAQVNWAAGLNAAGVLTYNLDPMYVVSWGGDWRLPTTPGTIIGYTNEGEMGHLYYESLEKPEGGPLGDTDPFENLMPYSYWSGTEYDASNAWTFVFGYGDQWPYAKSHYLNALAVRSGEVAPVPEPASMLLLGSGLVGLAAFRKKFRKR